MNGQKRPQLRSRNWKKHAESRCQTRFPCSLSLLAAEALAGLDRDLRVEHVLFGPKDRLIPRSLPTVRWISFRGLFDLQIRGSPKSESSRSRIRHLTKS